MGDQLDEVSKKRAPNFNSNDKDRLLNLVFKYRDVIENKKTDAVHNEDKAKTWSRIALEFNACGGNVRGVEQLKKLYNNQKKNLRKSAAEERKDILLTGGGISQKRTYEDALLRSIVNEKTIDGLINEFDGDHIELSCSENVEHNNKAALPELPPLYLAEIETVEYKTEAALPQLPPLHVAEVESDDTNNAGSSKSQWKQYTPSRLQRPLNTSLKSNRRRPTPAVRALTSSDVAEKYNRLLDKRLAIAELTEKQLNKALEFDEKKRDMELKILELELKIKQKHLESFVL